MIYKNKAPLEIEKIKKDNRELKGKILTIKNSYEVGE